MKLFLLTALFATTTVLAQKANATQNDFEDFFRSKSASCTGNPGRILLVEATLKASDSPLASRVRELGLKTFCDCYYDGLRKQTGDETAKLIANYDQKINESVALMQKAKNADAKSTADCTAAQFLEDKSSGKVANPFEQLIASPFVIGKGIGGIELGITLKRLKEIVGTTNAMTTTAKYDEFRYGPNLIELKVRIAPPGPDGKVVWVQVNRLFRGPITQGIKMGDVFESVIEKMKPAKMISKDRNVGLLIFDNGAQFNFSDYNKGILEGLIAFDPKFHPLL